MARKNGVPNGFEGIALRVSRDFGEELLAALPELDAAVKTGDGEASASATLQIRRCKKSNGFKASLRFRVRAPRAPREYDMRISDGGQLELGLAPLDPAADDTVHDGEGNLLEH